MSDTTYPYVWHDIYVCDMTHLCVWQVGHVIEDPFNVHIALAGSGQEDAIIIEGSQVKKNSFFLSPLKESSQTALL